MRNGLALANWLLVCGISASTLHADEGVLLRYRFQAGQVVRYSVTMRDEYTIQVGAASDEPYTEQNSVKQYRVLQVNDDGSARLELKLESAKLTVVNEGQTREFDSSANNNQDPVFASLQNMLGKPHLQATASPLGMLSELKLLIGAKETPYEVSHSALDAFVPLPETPVAVGASWREDLEFPVRVTETLTKQVKAQRRFHLLSIENGQATIQYETKIISPVSEPDEEIQLIRRPTRCTLVLDLERGVMVSKTVTLDNTVTNFGGGPSVMTLKQVHKEQLLEQVAQGETATRQ
ncbi:MAG: hypothetical protein KDA58_15670 [Planctomycetaceae bacterium]|nr:hypothetical protein [Planctomycetaceae bacterium]